jgi:hypothetical protein
MGVTRQESNTSQTSQRYEQLKRTADILFASVLGGTVKSSVLYIPHKFSFYINTADHKATWTQAAKYFYKQGPKFFRGLDSAVAYSSINFGFFLGYQINIRQAMANYYPDNNASTINSLAATAAAVCTTFTVSPLAIWKQKRMLDCVSHQEFWNEFKMPPFTKSWRGVTAKIMTDAINTGMLYSTLELLNKTDKYLRGESSYSVITPTIGGAIAGFVASIASNPFAVIVAKQRQTYESFLKTMTRIYQGKGLAGFYPKFLGISAINGVFQGVILNHLKCYVDKIYAPSAAPAPEKKTIPQPNRNVEANHFHSLSSKKKKNMHTLFHLSSTPSLNQIEATAPKASLGNK